MTRTWIKICGVRDAATARVAAEAGADAIGLVFVERSPRYVTIAQAREIIAALPPSTEPIALFVDEHPEQVREIARKLTLRTVQLHGRESAADIAALTPLRVIKAVHDPAAASDFPAAAALLFDASPQDQALPGGTGQTFDWQALAQCDRTGWPPVILAGGLNTDNVAEAIRIIRPYGVDVSSGVEFARGVKDHAKIRSFCAAVRESTV